MSVAILFHFLCAQHVSDINISSSGACDCVVELPHRSSCSQFVVCWRLVRLGVNSARIAGWSTSCASACKTNTTQNQPNQNSNTQWTENKTTDVVIQQHSRKLLMMDILMFKTCWAHKKWNKTAGDIKLVFPSSTITMMHGLINIRFNSSSVNVRWYEFKFKSVTLFSYVLQACVTAGQCFYTCVSSFRVPKAHGMHIQIKMAD